MPEQAAKPAAQASSMVESARGILANLGRVRDLLIVAFVISTLVIIVLPLPAWMMDFLLALNITLSLVVLLATIYVSRPTDLSVFPSLLLVLTLYRLSLNIATTRLILTRAPTHGADAAGHIIRTFGIFVTAAGEESSGLAVGLVIFVILVVIQFVVITKGATRIAEVAARFTLDAMPGQQMAIDADLNAGLIDEVQAKTRREDLRQLTDFYGAMDGASKFVRGDAIAGIIITIVNIAAGLIIGTSISDPSMSLGEAGTVFTTLTIGDGLVSQIPALLLGIASGLLVTRSAGKSNFGEDVIDQLFYHKRVVGIAALILTTVGLSGVVGITPLPSMPLLLLAAVAGVNWWNLGVKAKAVEEERHGKAEAAAGGEGAAEAGAAPQEKVEDLLKVDPMEIEVGYGLVPLVDVGQSEQGGGGLLGRVTMIRHQMASDLGIIVPPIRIRDNIQLEPNHYVIKIQGNPVAHGTAEPDRYLAMDSGMATERVDGIETVEPAFGLPAVWIPESSREHAEQVGYTVVDAETVVATHLSETIRSRAHELLTREETRHLLDALREHSPNLVQEVVPEVMSLGDIQKVLQNLLRERVSIRSLPVFLEILADIGRRTKDPDILTEYCRNRVARWLCNQYAEDGTLYVVTLDPSLEEHVAKHVEHTEGGSFLSLRPAVTQKINEAIVGQVQTQLQAGHANALLLTSPQIRLQVKRMTESVLPMLVVFSYNEVLPEYEVQSLGMVTVDL